MLLLNTLACNGQGPTEEPQPKLLFYSETAGFRHPSIPDAQTAIEGLASDMGFTVDTTDTSTVFNPEDLASYAAVVFLLTSGDILNDGEQAAFEGYIRNGGGYVGIHSASDTEYSWPWYGQLVGAYFANHPVPQTATVIVEDRDHPSTCHLPEKWERHDEWYNFRSNPRDRVNVLLRLDEGSYDGGNMDGDHPIAWYQEFDGGRSWYTGGGHGVESYAEHDFLQHIRGGILYAAYGIPPELRIHEVDTSSGEVTLRLSASDNFQYELFRSADFSTWHHLETLAPGTEDGTLEYTHGPIAGWPVFYRVEVSTDVP